VAPFPSTEGYDPNFDPAQAQKIVPMLGRLATILLSQSRFLGESLGLLTSGDVFSRFVIAPSDPSQKNKSALQCASLRAFGGFMERSFRAHDFLLGRRNCQMFLKSHFLLPLDNPVIAAGQAEAGGYASTIKSKFSSNPPKGINVPPYGQVWVPVIPLVGTAFAEVPNPARGTITDDRIQSVAGLVLDRLDAIKDPLLDGAPFSWILKRIIGLLCNFPGSLITRKKIAEALTAALSPDGQG
jgi:hypothetical protein